MATTGITNGTLGVLYVGATAIAHLKTNSFEISAATRDATSKDSGGWEDVLESTRSWTMSAEAFFAEDAGYGFEDLYGIINTRAQVTIKLSSEVSGDVSYSGSAYVTSLSKSDPNEDSSSFSVSFKGTGAITKATIV